MNVANGVKPSQEARRGLFIFAAFFRPRLTRAAFAIDYDGEKLCLPVLVPFQTMRYFFAALESGFDFWSAGRYSANGRRRGILKPITPCLTEPYRRRGNSGIKSYFTIK